MKVVDLGTKLGNSIGEFRKKGRMYYGDDIPRIKPAECLGIDMQDKYESDCTKRGYGFLKLDVTAEGALEKLPESDYYLAWDFLEHLPNKVWSTALIKVMLHKARKGVWLRMPSFEQDERTGEAALRKLGLRFAWTDWHGHPSHYLIEDALQAINEYKQESGRGSISTKVRAGKRIRATDDPSVVPIDSPTDTVKYSPQLGHKPVVDLNPHVIGQWEVVITV